MTQGERILQTLLNADGGWVSGRYFLHEMMISQYHARIKELADEKKLKIEPSPFTDEKKFKSYRLVKEPVQAKMFA